MVFNNSRQPRWPWMRAACLGIAVFASTAAMAVDNPDAPDRLAAFEQRIQPLEAAISNQNTTADMLRASNAYAKQLDVELNQTYRELMAKLGAPAAQKLRVAQRGWLSFMTTEAAFIDGTWNAQDFGSASALSRSEYRNSLTKARIVQLLGYLRSYP
ncbi:uncharacterized protein YecT (DUF1311 family) [Comamonas sp. BIGb0152]|uniref:lysozyme inhibitor LprI family protein n=1 Tax=Comamonas sp. BIGb0152 TaxID=2940601 RepID=UPI002169E8B2|nr:DUF1311 domain-containing protein [Comamonas sp. BIGb0152]MCS4294065.1 uncharacterized protein YecT (DUF1311 family) [Comamonas sp. BIGb0152]